MLLDAAGVRSDATGSSACSTARGGGPRCSTWPRARRSEDMERRPAFTGTDRAAAEYLRDEVLDPDSPPSGLPASDGGPRAADRPGLRRGADRTVRPGLAGAGSRRCSDESLDRVDSAFRHNPLVAEMLRAELAAKEPDRRASCTPGRAWYARAGDPAPRSTTPGLPRHAARRPARLATPPWPPRRARAGRRVAGAAREPAVRRARAGVTGAVHHLTAGSRGAAGAANEHRPASPRAHPVPGGEAAVALLRACLGRDGLAAMVADDAPGARAVGRRQPVAGAGPSVLGVAHHLAGDPRRPPRSWRTRRAARAERSRHPGRGDAQLALLAAEDGDWEEADRRAQAHAAVR